MCDTAVVVEGKLGVVCGAPRAGEVWSPGLAAPPERRVPRQPLRLRLGRLVWNLHVRARIQTGTHVTWDGLFLKQHPPFLQPRAAAAATGIFGVFLCTLSVLPYVLLGAEVLALHSLERPHLQTAVQ